MQKTPSFGHFQLSYMLKMWVFRCAIISILILCAAALSAAPELERGAPVVATTSWTAAFAYAAGADNVYILAPYELRHPPEYELKPSDLAVISEAEYIIFAGYERMVGKIREAIGEGGPALIQIATDYSKATIEASLLKIAGHLGTEDAARSSIEEIGELYVDWRREISDAGLAGAPVLTHFFLRPMALELGLSVAGVFGPMPPEAKQIVELSDMKAVAILDNWHNDIGMPLIEIKPDIPALQLINFPGYEGTRTLLDVLIYNRRLIGEQLLSGLKASH